MNVKKMFRYLFKAGGLSVLVSASLTVARICVAQEMALTNSFPTNLFLTDENKLFCYMGRERLIPVNRIVEAQKAKECRPADQDPEGHWGSPMHGCQLSLRLEKLTYTNGEPVMLTMLFRNVSGKPLTYLRQIIMEEPSPIYVSVWKGEKRLSLKADDRITVAHSAINVTLQPRTQHRYRLQLDKCYDLTESGQYCLLAEYGSTNAASVFPVLAPGLQPITSQKVTISITNAPAH